MTMSQQSEIKQIIEAAIPLDMTCAMVRSEQIARRAALKLAIEELLRSQQVNNIGPSVLK